MVRTKEQLEKMFTKSREEHTKKKIKPKVKKKKVVKSKKEEIYYLDNWKTDKGFLTEKLYFYETKKRKRKIDKDIAMILYYVLNGTEKELDMSTDTWLKSVDSMFPSQVSYIKEVYDGYLTDKYTKRITDCLK